MGEAEGPSSSGTYPDWLLSNEFLPHEANQEVYRQFQRATAEPSSGSTIQQIMSQQFLDNLKL